MSKGSRRFTLLDVMVLVAATAVGLAVVRESVPAILRSLGGTGGNSRSPGPDLRRVCLVTLGLAPLAASWGLGLLIMGLLQPRPSLRRLARQPGFVACCALALWMVLGAVLAIPFADSKTRYGHDAWTVVAIFPMGYAVAASWLALALGGRWRPVPGLLDRAGRVLGIYSIATIPAFVLTIFGNV